MTRAASDLGTTFGHGLDWHIKVRFHVTSATHTPIKKSDFGLPFACSANVAFEMKDTESCH